MKIRSSKINFQWSSDMAYAVGLLTTDGSLSIDGRHIELTSKDLEQLENFKRCLGITAKIAYKKSGSSRNTCMRIQFGDVIFYKFLLRIGLKPAKTKTLQKIKIPKKYFFDFLRGCFDGDGTFYSYWDKRWKSSFMYYLALYSASFNFLNWIHNEVKKELGINGHLSTVPIKSTIVLRYAKREALILLKHIYGSADCTCLSRKRLKIISALNIIGKRL